MRLIKSHDLWLSADAVIDQVFTGCLVDEGCVAVVVDHHKAGTEVNDAPFEVEHLRYVFGYSFGYFSDFQRPD